MEFRTLGSTGLRVGALSFGTGTFGGGTPRFRAWGNIQVKEARCLVAIAIEAGINLFDCADGYSDGLAEKILGQAMGKRRHETVLATKAGFRSEPGPNGMGSSRHHLLRACEASLKRLGTDYIDLYQIHGFDAMSPAAETLRAMEDLIRAGKVRHIGASNYSAWHLMKGLGVADADGLPRYASHQIYYSLIGRDFEWELMPLALAENVGTLVFSPLAQGQLTGKFRRGRPVPKDTRLASDAVAGPPVIDELLYRVVDALDTVASETGRPIPQIAINWVLHRPAVSSVIVGARNEKQLRENLKVTEWSLSDEHAALLDAASAVPPPYPHWHQRLMSTERNPPPV